MTHFDPSYLRSFSSWLSAVAVCATLFGLTACDPDEADADAEFRSEPLGLDSLERGDCLALDEEITIVTSEAWTLGPGLPKGVVTEDHFLRSSVFEDHLIFRISGPATHDGDTLSVASAAVIYDSPQVNDPCEGFCDGICVDGECYMNLPPFAMSVEGVCLE